MSVASVAPAGPTVFSRRNVVVAIFIALAAALGLAIVSRPDIANSIAQRFGSAVGQSVKDGVHGIKTVAAMMAERSPGERSKGALASLKHKRVSELHQRALPKVRRPSQPVSPLAAILMPPPAPPAIAPAAPLYGLVAAPPVPIPPIGAIPVAGGGGPPIVAIPPSGGGGGGGGVVPPVTTTPGTPTPPTQTPAVPEPDTWALMLLGFGFVGLAVRRDRRRAALAATD
jgi:PEP-CTERM motif